ncbi:MAG: hypothetical protein QNI90_14335 [Dinoroseobacter sp.]|nr:hypothetical protein [Dinoroseobacter sp.]
MALFALCLWPLIALVIAARMPRPAALVWMTILPYMFLPENYNIDLPGLPPLEKSTVIAGSLILAFALIHPPERGPRPKLIRMENARPWLQGLLWVAIAGVFIGAFLTIRSNSDPIILFDKIIPSTGMRDLLRISINTVARLTPFLLAIMYLRTEEDRTNLLRACVIAGLIYTLFMLLEMRLSPQLHNWVYGFHQHSFSQHVRGGFRPKVFLGHGLQVGFFILTAVVSALALWKQTGKARWGVAMLWLVFMLLLSRNLGAVLIAIVLCGLLILNIQKLTRAVVITVCIMLLAYPSIRVSPISPVGPVLALAESISADRAQSFGFRLKNEDQLLEKAMERPLFGWGGWGRNLIYNERGRDISITDGLWIIVVGSWGWVGYLSFFTILCLPLLAVAWQTRRVRLTPVTTGMLLITTGNLVDVIPNAFISPISWLMFGGLFGYALTLGRAPETEANPVHPPPPQADRRFSRFPTKPRQNAGLSSR